MSNYLLMSATGTTPPKYVHLDYDSAVIEANRLCKLYKCKITILQIIGEVELKEVPVTELKPVLSTIIQNDLPF
jgi:hypothetical protein